MTHDELRTAIRGVGLRATLQRIAVLRILSESVAPLSHADVSLRLSAPTEARSTIYRNLIALARVGLVRRVNGERMWRFELIRDTPHARSHPHFVCTSCGRASCLPTMRVLLKGANAPRAIEFGNYEVQVRGICDRCCG